ncbi:MAG: 50S ribosomal protein L25/general stress protein Ctc [Methylococcaceae bacterium]|nr:50S ribosomal protein L25/general stress protein Ctc [Methylococcaceae bacterium]
MSNVFEFVAESRGQSGTSAARVVRRKGRVPAVVYGGHVNPVLLSLSHNEVLKHLVHESVYSHVLDLTIDGKAEKVVLKALQRHPAKPIVLHMDFMRVNMQEVIKVHVPIHFKGVDVCLGVKAGGLLMPLMSDIEVTCLPGVLPEFIEIDITRLNVGDSVHLHDLTPPAGVQFVALLHAHDEEQDLALVRIAASSVAPAPTAE